jgi:arylsulfatase A-like enzyme
MPVSTRRVYHTILDAIGSPPELPNLHLAELSHLTLMNTIQGQDPEQGTAFSEVYPPINFLMVVEKHWPDLIEPFRCNSMRRAMVSQEKPGVHSKLIQVDEEPDELFDLETDPRELEDLLAARPSQVEAMSRQLRQMTEHSKRKQDLLRKGKAVEVEDERIIQQLRSLGYIE